MKNGSFQRFEDSVFVSESSGSVSVEIFEPEKMRALIVLAHGAGAGMKHAFMVKLSTELAAVSVGTIRYNFPYMEQRKKRPDPPALAHKAVAAALNYAQQRYPAIPLFAGGKSFGGRMTSQYVSKESPSFLKGIVFYGFPLHPAGKPSIERADHLAEVQIPMLFLQGTRDALAELPLIQSVCSKLPTATLTLFEGADHSFLVSRKDIIPALVDSTGQWLDKQLKNQ